MGTHCLSLLRVFLRVLPPFLRGLRLRLDTLKEYRVDLMRVREVHIHTVVGVNLVTIYTEESRGSAFFEVFVHDLHCG